MTRLPTQTMLYRLLPAWAALLALLLMLAWYPAFGRDLWTDEAFSASYTQHPTVGAVLQDVRKNEETPPIYFLVIWAWARLAGSGALALRVLSLLLGVLSAGVFAELARRWLAPREALFASALFASAPVLARYLAEVRGYTLLLLLTLLCIAAFEHAYRNPMRPAALAAYAVSAAALFLTSYFGLALIAAHNLIWLLLAIRQRARWQQLLLPWCVAQIGVALIVLPWLPSLLYQMRVAPAVSPFQNAQPQHFFWLLLMPVMYTPPSTAWSALWLVLAVAGWGLIVMGLLRANAERRGLLLRTFSLPGLVLLGLIIWMGAIGPRYLLTVLPGIALATGAGLGALQARRPRLAQLAGVAGVAGVIVYRLAVPPIAATGTPWSELAPEVARQADASGDVVLFHPPMEQRTFDYYYSGPPLREAGAYHYDDFYYTQGHSLQSAWTLEDALRETQGSRRIWMFYNPALGTARLDLPYPTAGSWRSGQVELTLYQVPAGSE
jgi:mannosyltransferase